MPQYILMNKAQADQVRGQTTAGHAFAPVPVPNTSPQIFAAPVECENDPWHANIQSLLQSFQHATTAVPARHPDTALLLACTFDEDTWTVGKKIIV